MGGSGDVAAIFIYSPICAGLQMFTDEAETEPHMWANLMEKVINVRKTNTPSVNNHEWSKYLQFHRFVFGEQLETPGCGVFVTIRFVALCKELQCFNQTV